MNIRNHFDHLMGIILKVRQSCTVIIKGLACETARLIVASSFYVTSQTFNNSPSVYSK